MAVTAGSADCTEIRGVRQSPTIKGVRLVRSNVTSRVLLFPTPYSPTPSQCRQVRAKYVLSLSASDTRHFPPAFLGSLTSDATAKRWGAFAGAAAGELVWTA